MKLTCMLVAGALSATFAMPAAHAAWPTQPIHVVVPYPPGGNLDITTRTVLAGMSKTTSGLTFVVENVGGAAGSIGSSRVARSSPDGYTVLATTIAPLIVNPVLMPGVKVKVEDFSPIGMMAVVPSVVEVHSKDDKYQDFSGFVDYVKQHPGQVSIGHSGNGTTNHLAVLRLMHDFKLDLIPVPYKGSSPALTDLMGQQIDAVVDQLSASQPHIDSGALRPLAATSAGRIPSLPDVPAASESGSPQFDIVTYSGLLVPRETPLAVRQQLNDVLQKALASQEVQDQLQRLGAEAVPGSVDETAELLRREQANLQPVIASGMLKPE